MTAAAPEIASPGALSRRLVGVCGALIAAGLVSFVAGLWTDAETTWRAFHVNYIYFATLAQGGVCLACAFVIIGAGWPGPVRFVPVGLAAWVPISFVLFAVSYLGREAIYTPWIYGPPPGKEGWLVIGRVYGSNLAVLGLLAWLSWRFMKASLRPALREATQTAPLARDLLERWTAGWRGDEAEREASEKELRRIAPIICLVYAFGYTLVGFDQVMSLSPTWFSTIFGWYFAWGGFLSGVAMTTFICVLLRRVPGWDAEIDSGRLHDLGKMLFAFSVFWMYLFFCQYIVIWYGNLPEETQFIQGRLGTQFLQDTWFFVVSRLDQPYVQLSLAAWLGCWIVPFGVLLGEHPKRTPSILGSVAAIMLVGFWLERNALVWPSLVPEPDDGWPWLGWIQVGIAAGFFGAFTLVYLVFSRVFPTLPLRPRS